MTRMSDYRMFVAIVETGSLSAAAHQLHRSVSAVSKQLVRFERDLGVSLVQRSTHALTITEPGQAFYQRCRAILSDIAEAEASLIEGTDALAGTLRLSLPEVLVNAGVLPLLAQFSAQHPGIRFDLNVSNQQENLEAAGLDAALRIAVLPDSSLTAVPLAQARTRICATPGYLARAGTPVSLDELVKHPLLLPSFVNLSDQVARLFPAGARPGIDIQQAHRFNSEHALFSALQAGMGIGFVLDLAVEPAIARGDLVALLPQRSLPTQPVHLVFRRGKRLPERLQAFKTFMVQHFAEQVMASEPS